MAASALRDLILWYGRLGPRAKGRKPYRHVAQVGEPTLRFRAEPVPLSFINSNDTKRNIQMLKYVMNRYSAVGLAAPQIGVNSQIFAMQFDKHHLEVHKDAHVKEMATMPLMVFINPKMKIVNPKKVLHREACESLRGFSAVVPRYQEVHITALNESAEEFSINLKGWLARIAQHEMDHLSGIVYTDIMEKKSLECTFWEEINEFGGKISLSYVP